MKILTKNPALFRAPEGKKPPPLWIRSLLVLTCTGVSFAHGSNDGQKGMGLIMLILIGTVPMAYALDRAVPANEVASFVTTSKEASKVLAAHDKGVRPVSLENYHAEVTRYIQSSEASPNTLSAMQALMSSVSDKVSKYETYAAVPDEMKGNIRNDMYLTS